MTETSGITFTEMTGFLLSEATRIDVVQGDLVQTGIQPVRSKEAEHRIRICEAIINFIDAARGDKIIMDRLKAIAAQKQQQQQKNQEKGRTESNRVAGSGSA